MLQLTIPRREFFDNERQEFIYAKEQVLTLEHSLISLSKWESRWKKPFLATAQKTREESIDYLRCMTLNPHVDDDAYVGIPAECFQKVGEYIEDSHTATWFNERNRTSRKGNRGQVITSELIYYWMISYGIPFECQKWHLNRLLTLIRVCEIKNTPSKKMKQKDILASNRELNAARRKLSGSAG